MRVGVGRAFLCILPVLAGASPGQEIRPKDGDPFRSRFLPFLQKHCFECHDEGMQKGGLRLDSLASDLTDQNRFLTWVKIYDRVRAGEMPPVKQPHPTPDELSSVLEALKNRLVPASLGRRDPEGRSLYRRLNRVEYENTLRDLLALPGLEVKELLPEDGRAQGFTKVGGALELSHVQMAKYMEAAAAALRAATAIRPERQKSPGPRVFPGGEYEFKLGLLGGDAVFLKDKKYDSAAIPVVGGKGAEKGLREYEQSGLFPYRGSVGLLRSEDDAFHPQFRNAAPRQAGPYRLRISLWSFLWDKGEVKPSPRPEAATLFVGPRLLGTFDAPSLQPRVHEVVAWLNDGDVIGFDVPSIRHVRISESGGRAAGYAGAGVAVDWLEIESLSGDAWPPQSHRRLFGDLPLAKWERPAKKEAAGAAPQPPRRPNNGGEIWTVTSRDPATDGRRLLSAFLKSAFRRTPPSGEVNRYFSIFRKRLDARESFEEALHGAYTAALCSPDFLFLRENRGRLDDGVLASRLSYFLWNSMPDDELLSIAQRGGLRDSRSLDAQVERMLEDAKAERFIADFTDQWLELRDIDATMPDARLYPEYGPFLRDAMLGETRGFFRELVAKDLPAQELVDSDWAMLNQRLAEHYAIPGIQGTGFRRVTLPVGSHRGGVMTMASVLKVTANGTATSPVKRGVWVLDRIFARPPSPPPPNTPALDPDVRGTTTVREQLARHRNQPVCASCHASIDPAGFALESFDVIGGWRTRYRERGGSVECAGELPDGRPFKDIDELKRLLRAQPEAVARGLAEKLIIYATGAGLDFADRVAVEALVARAKEKGYGVRTLIHEVVRSEMFQSK